MFIFLVVEENQIKHLIIVKSIVFNKVIFIIIKENGHKSTV